MNNDEEYAEAAWQKELLVLRSSKRIQTWMRDIFSLENDNAVALDSTPDGRTIEMRFRCDGTIHITVAIDKSASPEVNRRDGHKTTRTFPDDIKKLLDMKDNDNG